MNQVVKILPIRVGLLDQREFPLASPTLQALFMGDAVIDCIAAFGLDEARQTAPRAIIGTCSFTMLGDARGE
jgi:hypothetical protein|tara:strand:+ start:163 stop:378 length:216 start_codon:yes stop_codon:yes gene_type:complete